MQIAVLEVAHAAMDEPRRSARRPRRKVLGLHERHTEPTTRGIARDTRAGDSTTDNQEVEAALTESGETLDAALSNVRGA